MATVADLIPGDLVTMGPDTAVFITRTGHPKYQGLTLVAWKMLKSSLPDYPWSFDALDSRQEVGEVTPSTGQERMDRLEAALTGKEKAGG